MRDGDAGVRLPGGVASRIRGSPVCSPGFGAGGGLRVTQTVRFKALWLGWVLQQGPWCFLSLRRCLEGKNKAFTVLYDDEHSTPAWWLFSE